MQDQLGNLESKAAHAAWLAGILGRRSLTGRTLDHWRNEPNGLPYTNAGQTPLFCREWTLEWLRNRRRQNNPTAERGKRQRAA
jgi:hypothetical protein